jgi:hypothetical protein
LNGSFLWEPLSLCSIGKGFLYFGHLTAVNHYKPAYLVITDRERHFMKATLLFVLLPLPWAFVLFGQTPSDKAWEDAVEIRMKAFGLTEEKLNKLKAAGIDVRESLLKRQEPNEMIVAAVSDLVVIGDVLEEVGLPGPKCQVFHSKVLVRVTSVLKGDLEGDEVIELLRQSGPLNDSMGIWVSSEANFKPGEDVLLSLVKPENSSFLTIFHKNLFEGGKFKSPVNAFWGGSRSKYPIKNGKVYFQGRERDLDEIVQNVKNVDRILRNAQ